MRRAALLDETERDERYSSKSAIRDHERYPRRWVRKAGVNRQAAWQIDAGTRSIVERIVNFRKPKRVILFGSRGRGSLSMSDQEQ